MSKQRPNTKAALTRDSPSSDSDIDTASPPKTDPEEGRSQATDERGTPAVFIRQLQDALGGKFSLDPCAGSEPMPIAHTRFTKSDNGLAQSWAEYSSIFVNPPYSDLPRWLKKVHREVDRDPEIAPELVICLLPAYTSTQWFHRYVAGECDYLVHIEGRLSFADAGDDTPFASILAVYGEPSDSLLTFFDRRGHLFTGVEITSAAEQQRLDEYIAADTEAASEQPQAPMQTGPTIRDVSDRAPAVPQDILPFEDLGRGDILEICFETSLLGTPTGALDGATIEILSVTPDGPTSGDTPAGWITALGVDPTTETYVLLYQDPAVPTRIEASVAPNGRGWDDRRVTELTRLEATGIQPYRSQPSISAD